MEFTEASLQSELEVVPDPNSSTSPIPRSHAAEVARSILTEVMRFRRFSGRGVDCATTPCPHCFAPHFAKIVAAVSRHEPIPFVLPAFPGKSPNLAKVFGPRPDMAERCALEFLQHLCDRIGERYSPGARIILCSDGRVFSDDVGMRDEDVTAYQREIRKMILDLGLNSISTFDLEELYEDVAFDEMRSRLMDEYGAALDELRASVSRGKESECSPDDREAHRLYCGITRFLLEDSAFPGQTRSRTALQKECRARAYRVIQKSKAWGELVEDRFPAAVRLSIHPQSCGARKLGIRLIEPDNWQTPWHGVAVQVDGRYVLMKRSQAEALGAQLVTRMGRPSHYVLTSAVARGHEIGVASEA